ncbi:MAG: hypothetical protein RIS94_1990 [Pseudomonadota bacterium]|jgi:hypothetical protein
MNGFERTDLLHFNPGEEMHQERVLSPVEFERQQTLKAEGVQKSRGYSNDIGAWLRQRVPHSRYAPEPALKFAELSRCDETR